VGTRAGNIILQQSDLVIVLGSRLPIRQVSYNWENFAKSAIKVGVDIDPAELSKPMVSLDVLINADVSSFVKAMILSTSAVAKKHSDWLLRIKKIRDELPAIDPQIRNKGHSALGLNPYLFIEDLWGMLSENEIVACADASASVIPLQVAPIKAGQRIFTNAGSASMGYELPAAIGASFANPGQRIVCLAGDGSIMLNIQELETISRYKLPIKILLLNNKGYLSIKLSQSGFFGRKRGADIESGLGFPDFSLLSQSVKIVHTKIKSTEDYSNLRDILELPGPAFVDIDIDPNQAFEPKLGSFRKADGSIESNSLENMSPVLSPELIKRLME
jgi:acetolactate synthase-1/2/3 large subunit